MLDAFHLVGEFLLAETPVPRIRISSIQPQDWPDGRFDLIVVSEVGYFMSPAELDTLISRIVGSLDPAGGPCSAPCSPGPRSPRTRR